tara:strand:- start:368 stop:679 length:312 start_codon:yes stop_codon:yes gene_type:complete
MVTKKDFKKAIFGYLTGLAQEPNATMTEAEHRRFHRAWSEVQETLERLSGGDGFEYSQALYFAREGYFGSGEPEPFATGLKRQEGHDSEELEKMGMKGVISFD